MKLALSPSLVLLLGATDNGTLLLMVVLFVVQRCELHSLAPARLLGRLRWFGVLVIGQTRGAWLLALLLMGALAAIMANQIVAQGQSAIWAKLVLNAPAGTPDPAATFRYGSEKSDVVPIVWQPYPETAVALRPLRSDQAPLKIMAIDTDQGPVGLANFTSWAAVVYQRESTADLPINRPDRAVWAMPYAWGYDPYTLISYPQILKDAGDDLRHPYFTTGRQQAISINRARYYETVRLSLVYNMTFQKTGDASYWYWTELTGALIRGINSQSMNSQSGVATLPNRT